ncbi:AraC family transcriptional regulator [Nocardioides alcanivorans]|uniref:AraC family transcriptional regulator n=1 Tax=Nocardioides alcanivorans TaxID=2897352 RepID=UPI001F22C6D7|nr:AraC family transcriptional regulator [Nocardioides alcanivorans]
MSLDFARPAALSWDFPRDAAGLSVLVGHGRERGLEAPALLVGTGVHEDDLLSGEQLVTARQELRVVRNLRAALPDLFGVEVGARYRAETFGVLGFALLSSRTLAEAANLALRFIDLSHTFAIPTPRVEGKRVVVDFDDSALPDDVARFLVERDLTAVWKVLDQLHPVGFAPGRVTFRGAEPVSVGRHRAVLGVDPVFGATDNSLAFDAALLDTRLLGEARGMP